MKTFGLEEENARHDSVAVSVPRSFADVRREPDRRGRIQRCHRSPSQRAPRHGGDLQRSRLGVAASCSDCAAAARQRLVDRVVHDVTELTNEIRNESQSEGLSFRSVIVIVIQEGPHGQMDHDSVVMRGVDARLRADRLAGFPLRIRSPSENTASVRRVRRDCRSIMRGSDCVDLNARQVSRQ